MGAEIERKFLVVGEAWRDLASGAVPMRQGYLANDERCSVRVRLAGDKASINIKSATLGIRRTEFEYEIPVDDASTLLDDLCRRPLIEKTRYLVDEAGARWEVDVFEGENAGLVVAEIELDGPEQPFERPAWVGEEVSHDPRYYNVRLVDHPYTRW